MIEKNFDIPFIADLALREKQIQQNYRPIIAVHKWFARRPGTLFRGLLLSEFSGLPLREAFYRTNDLKGLRVADPFMGGGTPLLEANRLGCQVTGFDINPMSYWIVKQEIEHLDLGAYDVTVESLSRRLEKAVSKKMSIVADWLREFRGYAENDLGDQGEECYGVAEYPTLPGCISQGKTREERKYHEKG